MAATPLLLRAQVYEPRLRAVPTILGNAFPFSLGPQSLTDLPWIRRSLTSVRGKETYRIYAM